MDSNLSRETSHLPQPDPPGMMLGGTNNSYGPGLQHNPVMMPPSSGIMQPGMRLFNPVTSSPPSRPADPPTMLYSGDGQVGMRPCGGVSMIDPIKKKRGRPRKYGPDGSMSLYLMPPSSPSGNSVQTSEPTAKKRGRPLGSGKKHHLDGFGMHWFM